MPGQWGAAAATGVGEERSPGARTSALGQLGRGARMPASTALLRRARERHRGAERLKAGLEEAREREERRVWGEEARVGRLRRRGARKFAGCDTGCNARRSERVAHFPFQLK